jgi:uncharacterized pyridoxal phosphate-containing UPF0001 family protein
VIDCLLQIHIAEEESKFGFTPEELKSMLAEGSWKRLEHTRICGVMCMASNTDDGEQIEREFATVAALFKEIRSLYFHDSGTFGIMSAGMSEDYPIAIKHGSTHIRVGSRIFNNQ